MEDFKGRPTQWTIGEKEYFDDTNEILPINGKLGTVCVIISAFGFDNTDRDNAALIAAAPELLEALQVSNQIIKDLIASVPVRCLDEQLAANETVISKALSH